MDNDNMNEADYDFPHGQNPSYQHCSIAKISAEYNEYNDAGARNE